MTYNKINICIIYNNKKEKIFQMKFDEIDAMILSELEKNSRLSIRELSKRINLSPSSVTERLKRLEDNRIIEGYTISINKKNLGLSINCIIKVTMRMNGSKILLKTTIIVNGAIELLEMVVFLLNFQLKT